MARRLLAIVADDPIGHEPLREIRANGSRDRGGELDLRVEANALRHTLGDVDEPMRKPARYFSA